MSKIRKTPWRTVTAHAIPCLVLAIVVVALTTSLVPTTIVITTTTLSTTLSTTITTATLHTTTKNVVVNTGSIQHEPKRHLRSHGEPIHLETNDEDEEEEAEAPKRSSISDVWLCMGIAIGWTIFTIRPLFETTMSHYAHRGITIQGHVLESKVDVSGGDTPGIPAYYALIDYIYEHEGSTIQVRKAFTTETLLDKGFANVWLIVLPDEPTSGILQDEWEVKFQKEKEEASSRARVFFITLSLGILFITLSVAGAVYSVQKLPSDVKPVGWISLIFALAFFVPVAFVMYRSSQQCAFATQQSAQEGKIIRGANFVPRLTMENCYSDPCDTVNALRPPSTDVDADAVKPPDRSNQEGFYFVCLSSYDKNVDNGSVSTVSSISMGSQDGTQSFDAEDVGLNAYRDSSLEL